MFVTNENDKIQIHLMPHDKLIGSYECDEIVVHANEEDTMETTIRVIEAVTADIPITLACSSSFEITPLIEKYINRIYYLDEDISYKKVYHWRAE